MSNKVDGHYTRVLENEVRSLGFDPSEEFLPYIAEDELRYKVWRARAALSVLRYLSHGGHHNLGYAVRTWGLVCEYNGRCGGWAPVGVSDALSYIGEFIFRQMRDGAEARGMGAISWGTCEACSGIGRVPALAGLTKACEACSDGSVV